MFKYEWARTNLNSSVMLLSGVVIGKSKHNEMYTFLWKKHVVLIDDLYLIVIEAEWRFYVSVNQTIIGSDNGLSTVRCQAIITTNTGSLWSSPFGDKSQRNLNQIETIFIEENEFGNVVCKMAPICLGLNLLCCNNGRVVLNIGDTYYLYFISWLGGTHDGCGIKYS